MGEAIGQILSFGVGVALSPIPIIAVDPDARHPAGTANGPCFVVGWLIGLAIVGAIVMLDRRPGRARTTTASRRPGSGS